MVTSAEFEKATDYSFKEEDIERAKALVGQYAPSKSREHLTEATHDAMRNFARSYGDDNPLYTDEAFAQGHGYDGVIAPPTLIFETNQFASASVPRDIEGLAGHRWDLELPGTRQVRGGNSYEWHRPARPTDVVTVTWTLREMAERQTRDGKSMLVVTSHAEYTNQTGERLATNEEQLIFVSLS